MPKAVDLTIPTPAATLQERNGSYLDHNGTNHTFVMVGADPSQPSSAATSTTIRIPRRCLPSKAIGSDFATASLPAIPTCPV